MANSEMTGPVPGDGISLFFSIEDGNKIVFTDGLRDRRNNFTYKFKDSVLLHQAFEVKYFPDGVPKSALPTFNNRLARLGDAVVKVFCERESMKNGEDGRVWNERFMYGISMNSYMAARADMLGVTNWLRKGNFSVLQWPAHLQPTTHERATAFEAIIGAVDVDSESDMAVLLPVMRRLGIWWPTCEIEVDIMDDYILECVQDGVLPARR